LYHAFAVSSERYFGDQTTFSVFSTPVSTTKTYNRFSDMADDVVNVRIYQGIHFDPQTKWPVDRERMLPSLQSFPAACVLNANPLRRFSAGRRMK